MIAEYGDVEIKDFSVRTVLESKAVGTRVYSLVHKTKGWEPAGSCARMVREAWGVLFDFENASHGQWFLDATQAKILFSKWTEKALEARVYQHGGKPWNAT